IGLTKAESVYDNPRWMAKTKRGSDYALIAEAIQGGLNRWTKDVSLDELLGKFYDDQCFFYPVACIVQRPVPGFDQGKQTSVRHKPAIQRVSFRRYFRDPLAIDEEECRFEGHTTIRDKEDLLLEAKQNPDAGWNVEAIEALATGVGLDKLRKKDDSLKSPDRKEIVLHHVWIPEWHPPVGDPLWSEVPEEDWDCYHGGIFTIAEGGKEAGGTAPMAFVRAPQWFYGHESGPYATGGEFNVPDETVPLSGFLAIEGQLREVNAQEKARLQADRRRKTLGFVSHKSDKLQKAVAEAADGSIVPMEIDDVRTGIVAVPLGGSSPEQHVTCDVLDQRLRRTSGISDTAAGQPNSDVTATAEAVADKGSTARAAWRKRQFAKFVKKIGLKVAYLLYHDDKVVMASDEEGGTFYGGSPNMHEQAMAAEMAPQVVQFLESIGAPPEQIPELVPQLIAASLQKLQELHANASFSDLDLDIEPQSMERVSEAQAQRKAMTLGGMVMQVASAAPTMPHFRSKLFLDDFGRAWDEPELGKYLDEEMLALQGALAAAQPQLATGMGSGPGQQGGMARPQMQSNVAPAARPQLPQRAGPSRQGAPGQSAGAKAAKSQMVA
ncbi:MAG TPA: hypothetical protein VEJ18_20670, partial [Planctomycetota bacterium]|nr:hypothetical protein [Planctomycetota bacterium]